MSATVETIKSVEEATGGDYKYGFVTDIDLSLIHISEPTSPY